MAVPAEFTTLDISGTFYMNKSLSDSTDAILTAQGVGWLKRRAISLGSLHLTVKHYKDSEDVERIDIDQVVAGLAGTREERVLNYEERTHNDHVFGHVIGKSRRIPVADVEEEFLKKGWTEETITNGAIESYVESDTPKSGTSWIAKQIWGTEAIDGVTRYTRHVYFTGPDGKVIEARLVYDYAGPLPESSA
ncbi:hypothetical protein BDN71DRAFT_1500661 [Pleurotus eryngii]|uniref:Uncharacterized protein n=1 Tax=Pleurotus eryngii TaxID=5323 RepID=A0A9P6ACT3_PLEER|nr:hypothetical protein BDN71DRAFT_1500661 [Pleurotus eryngii]